jgi:flagellar hook-length control protein FliK
MLARTLLPSSQLRAAQDYEAAKREKVVGLMEAIGSVSGLRDDAAMTSRAGKNATARRTDDQERSKGAFDDLLANLIAPLVPQPVVVEAPKEVETATSAPSDTLDVTAAPKHGEAVHIGGDAKAAPPEAQTSGPQSAEAPASAVAQTQIPTPPLQGDVAQSEGEQGLLAQLAALGVDEAATTSTTTAGAPMSNAATLAANRSNAGVNLAQQTSASLETQTDSTAGAPNLESAAATATGSVANDNATSQSATKPKSADLESAIKTPAQALEAVSATNDGPGSTSVVSGQEVALPANDQVNRAPQLTPHTIPMLAATMMRRLESGSKQFTMRLDPPELGQVEVKLTVAADKKVRAVISADRPEALADLVRSARDLARALQDAGLDLDDNSLTFQLNDPSSGDRHQNERDNQAEPGRHTSSRATQVSETELKIIAEKPQASSDPFQSWHRERVALTV